MGTRSEENKKKVNIKFNEQTGLFEMMTGDEVLSNVTVEGQMTVEDDTDGFQVGTIDKTRDVIAYIGNLEVVT